MDHKNKCTWERYASRYEILKNSDTYLCTLTTRYNSVTISIPTDECAYRYDKTKCPFFKKKDKGIPMKYTKKPVIIEAVQWTGENIKEIEHFTRGKARYNLWLDTFELKTLEGTMIANVDDYIIKGVKGEFYPCKPYIFEQTYELVRKIQK